VEADGLAGAALGTGGGLDVKLVVALDEVSGAWLVEVRRRKNPIALLLVLADPLWFDCDSASARMR
jgi:hypothetical protein